MSAIDTAQARCFHDRSTTRIFTFGKNERLQKTTVGEVLTLMQEQDLKIDIGMNCTSNLLIFSRLNERIVHTTEAQTDIPVPRIGFTNLCYLERNS
jgi:hypothetical protein